MKCKKLISLLLSAVMLLTLLTAAAPVMGAASYEQAGATVPFSTYEAEAGATNAKIYREDTDDSSLSAAALAERRFTAEISAGGAYVLLQNQGDYVEFQNTRAGNRLVVRYGIPENEPQATLSVYVGGAKKGALQLSAAQCYDTQENKRRYDEAFIAIDIPAGAAVKLQKDAGDAASWYAIDLIDIETAPEALQNPSHVTPPEEPEGIFTDPDLNLWVKASTGLTGGVWEDQSGKGNDMTPVGMPVYNSKSSTMNRKASFSLNKDGYFETVYDTAYEGSSTVFVAFNLKQQENYQKIFSTAVSTAQKAQHTFEIITMSYGKLESYSFNDSGGQEGKDRASQALDHSFPLNTPVSYAYRVTANSGSGAQARYYYEDAAGNLQSDSFGRGNADGQFSRHEGFVIGTGEDFGSFSRTDMEAAEALVFHRALTDNEVAEVRAYLDAKYRGTGADPFEPSKADFLDITDFGAVPDDGLDDTAAIKAAIAEAEAEDCAGIWIPEGTFHQNERILVPPGLDILGAGMWYSCIEYLQAGSTYSDDIGFALTSDTVLSGIRFMGVSTSRDDAAHLLRPVGHHQTIENIWVQNVGCVYGWMDQRVTGNPYYDGSSIADNGHDVVVRDSRIRGTYYDGIHFGDSLSYNNKVINCHFRGLGDDAIAQVNFDGPDWQGDPSGLAQDNMAMYNTVVASYWGRGIACVGGSNFTVQYNLIEDTYNAGLMVATENLGGNPSYPIVGLNMSYNVVRRAGHTGHNHGSLHIWLNTAGMENCVFDGNLIENGLTKGIQIDNEAFGDGGTTIIKNNVLQGNRLVSYNNDSTLITPYLSNNKGIVENMTDFETALAAAEAVVDTGYTQVSWDILQRLVAEGRAIKAGAAASQRQLESLALQLNLAIEGLCPANAIPEPGATVPFTTYEAEKGVTNAKKYTETTEDSFLTAAELEERHITAEVSTGGEYVLLKDVGDYVTFANVLAGNRLVLRYGIPQNAPDTTLNVYVNDTLAGNFTLTSAQCYDLDGHPRRYDEKFIEVTIPQGASVKLQKDAGNDGDWYAIDMIDVETAPAALANPDPAQYLDITAYGAVPDDGGDDTAAITAAIADAEAGGKKGIWIPGGTFHQDGRIVVPPNIDILGAGMWHTCIQYLQAGTTYSDDIGFALTAYSTVSDIRFMGVGVARDQSAHVFRPVGHHQTIQNVWIQNVGCVYGWNGRPVTNNPYYEPLADDLDGNNILVKDSRIRGTFFDGVHFGDGLMFDNTVTNCHFRGIGDDAIAQVNYNAPGWDGLTYNSTATHNTIIASYWGRGISCVGGSNFNVQHNLIEDCYMAGLMVATEPFPGGPATPIINLTMAYNTVRRTGHTGHNHAGLHFWLPQNYIKDAVFEGNFIEQGLTQGIHIDDEAYGDEAGRTIFRGNILRANALENYENESALVQPVFLNNRGLIYNAKPLEEKLAEAKAIVQGRYSTASWNALQKSIGEAEVLIAEPDDAYQEDWDAAVTKLQRAISNLSSGGNPSPGKPIEGIEADTLSLPGNGGAVAITVSGDKKAGATVFVVDENGIVVANTITDGDGKATVTMPENQTENERNYTVRVKPQGSDSWSGVTLTITVRRRMPFTDVPGSAWYYGNVYYAWEQELVNGVSETLFRPNGTMTRGMLVTVLGRAAGVEPGDYTGESFTDVAPDQYYAPYIQWASENGIVKGVTSDRFAPNSNITREQATLIFSRYADALKLTLPTDGTSQTFADITSLSGESQQAIGALNRAGVINGKSSTVFDPKGSAKRSEVTAMVHRFLLATEIK